MNLQQKILGSLLLFLQILNCESQIVDPLHFLNKLNVEVGLGWPKEIAVVEGHEVLLKLRIPLVNQERCEITTPQYVTFDTDALPSTRYIKWEDCGVRIKEITHADEGRWRITAKRGEYNITGFSEVHVKSPVIQPNDSSISLHDGSSNQQVNLSLIDNHYCMVTLPFAESSLTPGHCRVTLDKTTRSAQGTWDIVLGIPGQVNEIPFKKHVSVEAEHLDVGYVHDTTTNKLNLYCNLLHTEKNITFCRFQKASAQYGYNIFDGVSNGDHSYYGSGFEYKQCGMTIELPDADDFTSWRCSVGVQQWVDGTIHPMMPMQALISVRRDNQRSVAMLRQTTSAPRRLFIQRDGAMSLTCNAEESLQYCWFQDPAGKQHTPTEKASDDQEYWYSGEGLLVGDCTITFAHAKDEYAGLWKCHMGPKDTLGVDLTQDLQVKVTSALAAIDDAVVTTIGSQVELHCHSANTNRVLYYCRFLSPNFVGMNVDETITKDNAILNRYYFTPDKSIHHGECSLTIADVREEDLGLWTCAALLIDETAEARETILLTTDGLSTESLEATESAADLNIPRSRAGVAIGGSVSAIILLVILVAAIIYKRGGQPMWRRHSNTSSTIQMNALDNVSLGSNNSSIATTATVGSGTSA